MRRSITIFAALAAAAALAAGGYRLAARRGPAQETPGAVFLEHATVVRSEQSSFWLADPSRSVRLHSDMHIFIAGLGGPELVPAGEPDTYRLRPGPKLPLGGDFFVQQGAPGIVVASYRPKSVAASEDARLADGLEDTADQIDDMLARHAEGRDGHASPELTESFRKLSVSQRNAAARNRREAEELKRPRFSAFHARVVREKGGRLELASGAVEIELARGAYRYEPAGAEFKAGDIVDLSREPGGDLVAVSASAP